MSSNKTPIEIIKKNLPAYLNDVKTKHSEMAKSISFIHFLQPIFNVQSSEVDWEVPTNSRILKLRGRIDCVFGNTIFEFKKEFTTTTFEKAKSELKKYFQSHYEKSDQNILGIINDGIKFRAFRPNVENKIVNNIEEFDKIDLENSKAEEIYLWFDSYFFSSDKIIPTTADIKKRFGLSSPTFFDVSKKLEDLYEKTKTDGRVAIKYENWNRYLEVVYGDRPDEKKLFIRHTYLSTLVKLLIHVKMTKETFTRSSEDIIPILFGESFKRLGISNFIEDDFFTWISILPIRKQSGKIFYEVLREIYSYDLDKINEDVLKELYQELVNDEIRQQLGEFYTPDWLAEHMVIVNLENQIEARVMDPACGSGTFLFKTIQYKISMLRKQKMVESEILKHILNNVTGFDIHPLAIMIAKTNYLLALQEIIKVKTGPIIIPVYLSDSLKIPEMKIDVSTGTTIFEYEVTGNKKFRFPKEVVTNSTKMDEIIEKMKKHGEEFSKINDKLSDPAELKQARDNVTKSFQRAIQQESTEIKPSLIESLDVLFDFIEKNNDSIWPYFIRNMYKPVSLATTKVDVLLGNPPWITLQNMKNQHYQDYLKSRYAEYEITPNAQNIPHMDLGSLFFCQTSDKYLKDGGKIAFVMPRSTIQASHQKKFREFKKPELQLLNIDDFHDNTSKKVEPLFKIPSCTLYAIKNGKTKWPVKRTIFSGKLETSNAQLIDAKKVLQLDCDKYEATNRNYGGTYYYELFKQGCTIVPGAFWFVKLKIDSRFGINPQCPLIITDEERERKKPWNTFVMEDCVEKEFLFTTVTGSDIVPFNKIRKRLLVLPIDVNDTTRMVEASDTTGIMKPDMKNYLTKVEQIFEEKKPASAKKMTIYQWINWRNKLTDQKPSSFKVLYTAKGKYLAACVVKGREEYDFGEQDVSFPVNNELICEAGTYWFNTESKKEAHYLCAILNSKVVDDFIKPMQSQGMLGPRDIHLTPLEFPAFVKFDEDDPVHNELAEISGKCEQKVNGIIKSLNYTSLGRIRTEIRIGLSPEIIRIDELVTKLYKKS